MKIILFIKIIFMNVSIFNKNNLSNENNNNIKVEGNIEIESINSQEKLSENNNNPKCPNKFFNFIKNKPLLFLLILILICAVIVLAITLPIVLIKKNKNKTDENSSNNNKNESPTIIEIDSTKQFDFSNSNNIDDIYNNIGDKCNDLTIYCNYLSENSNGINDKEKVYLIYKWVANNIQYDSNYIEPQDVLTNKKGSYSGYANLFTKLLTCLNVPADNIKNIKGHSKGIGFNYEDPISDDNTNHEWNAVKIDNKWCLIDTTWGANSIINDAYVRKYDEYYLCTPPAQFVRSHLPKKIEENLQFLDKPIDINTFQNMAFTTKYFFEYGFNGLSNDKMVQNICGDGKMTLKYNKDIRPVLSVIVKKDETEYNNWIMEKKISKGYDVIVYINEEGNYDVEIGANIDKSENYINILKYKVKCNSTPNIKKYFPEFRTDYKNDDGIELISPIEGELIQGQYYNFEIISNNYGPLYLYVGFAEATEIIEMDKEGTTYKENNLMVHGDSVIIAYKESEMKMVQLVIYSTKGNDIYFPQTFETPFKKRLESPLETYLTFGETYNFKIICDTSYSIAISYNNNWYDFEKNGFIYTLTFSIDEDAGELSIMFGNEDDHSDYEDMYIYFIDSS